MVRNALRTPNALCACRSLPLMPAVSSGRHSSSHTAPDGCINTTGYLSDVNLGWGLNARRLFLGLTWLKAPKLPYSVPTARVMQNATIIQNIGCISITGLEDGYKKVNQDKVCVLAQFLDPEQSFFAALDGHGPSGAHISASTNMACQLAGTGPQGACTIPHHVPPYACT
jgi:hypothetical protein